MESSGTSSGQWDALMGLDNSPPPPYSSAVHPPASAPPQSLPPTSFGAMGQRQDRPVFPPDVSAQGGRNLKVHVNFFFNSPFFVLFFNLFFFYHLFNYIFI